MPKLETLASLPRSTPEDGESRCEDAGWRDTVPWDRGGMRGHVGQGAPGMLQHLGGGQTGVPVQKAHGDPNGPSLH